jgi:hypothetical protein
MRETAGLVVGEGFQSAGEASTLQVPRVCKCRADSGSRQFGVSDRFFVWGRMCAEVKVIDSDFTEGPDPYSVCTTWVILGGPHPVLGGA